MTVTALVTTQHGISVSLTVPAGRYRIIRRASLHRAIVPATVRSATPAHPQGLWSHLGTWLLHPDAERLHARRQAEAAVHAQRERQAQERLFLSFP